MRPDEFARVIGTSKRHGVQAERTDFIGESLSADLGDVPSVGVDRAIAHTPLAYFSNHPSFR